MENKNIMLFSAGVLVGFWLGVTACRRLDDYFENAEKEEKKEKVNERQKV